MAAAVVMLALNRPCPLLRGSGVAPTALFLMVFLNYGQLHGRGAPGGWETNKNVLMCIYAIYLPCE